MVGGLFLLHVVVGCFGLGLFSVWCVCVCVCIAAEDQKKHLTSSTIMEAGDVIDDWDFLDREFLPRSAVANEELWGRRLYADCTN